MEIERIGKYLEVDDGGYLQKVAAPELVQSDWREPVDELRRAYLDRWGRRLHSIYLRGSVARGSALAGVSDIDSFAVLVPGEEQPARRDELGWYEHMGQEMGSRYPHVAGVELNLRPFTSATDRRSVDSFIIAVEAICLHGPDLAEQLAPFRPSSEAAFQTRWFREHFAIFERDYPGASEADKRHLLVWLMRRFLRLGMELVMEREQRYSRDLYLCYESFACHYPDEAAEMWRALELAVNPSVDDSSGEFALQFGAWLEAEAERRLAEWGQEFAR